MIEIAKVLILGDLPAGAIVGSAVIEKVTPPDPSDADGMFSWHLADVKCAKRLRTPERHTQPAWFNLFGDSKTEEVRNTPIDDVRCPHQKPMPQTGPFWRPGKGGVFSE